MEDRGPTFAMTCLCVLLAGWIVSYLAPAGLLFFAFRPATRWDLALIWGGLVTAPLQALVVKLLLRALAHGQVSYAAALLGCVCGAVVSTAVFTAQVSSTPSSVGVSVGYFPALISTVGLVSAIASVVVAGMVVWGSAAATT